MYLPVTHICFGHSETTRLRKPCAASHQPGQSNLRSGCWWMNGYRPFSESPEAKTQFLLSKRVCERWSWWPHKWSVELFCLLQCSWRAQIAGLHAGETRWIVTEGAGFIRSGQLWWFTESFCQLIAEEDLWLADTREFLSNCPEWPMAEATGMQAEGAPILSNICILKILLGKDEGPWGSYQELSKKRLKRTNNLNRSWEQTSMLCLVFGLCKALPSKYFCHLWLKLRWISGWAERTLETLAVREFPCLAKRPIRATKKGRNWGFLSVKFLCPILLACGELMCKSNIQSLRGSKAVDSKLSAKMIFGSLLLTGQLTEHLRRKSEQTLVAAADLRLSALFLEVFGWDMVATLMGIDWYSIPGYVSLWLQCNMNENMQWIQEIHTGVLFFNQWRDSSRQNRRFFDQGTVFTQVILKHLSQASGELVTAVQRDALSVQAEEEALCKAEEEGTISDTALSLVHIWNLLESFEILISCYFLELPSCALHDPIHSSVMFRILQTNSNSLS